MLKPKKKITRKEIKKDPVLENIAKAEAFIREKTKLLGYILIAVTVILVLSILMIRSKKKANIEAAGELGIAEMAISRGDIDDAVLRLENIVNTYKGTKNAGVATALLAQTHLNKSEYEEAEQNFKRYVDKFGDDDMILASAYSGLAVCAEKKDDYGSAAGYFEKAGKIAPYKFQKHEYQINGVRNLIKTSQLGKADQIVTDLLQDDPNFQNKSALEQLSAQIKVLKG